jgi:3-oxoacyl-[acyl-carrier-protein] synthase II
MLGDRLQIVITGIGFRSALGDLASTWQGLLAGQSALEILPHSPAIAGARQIGSRTAVLAPMAACATGIRSIAQAVNLIRSRTCDRAIAGAVETPITPLTIAGFAQIGALATTGCYPFDI